MTTSTTTPRLAYTADGSTVAFTFNFEIADASSIAVYDGSTKKTLTTHYTVSFDSGTSGTGTVTFTSAPSASNVVTLVRDTNLARTTDFENSGAFLASTVNAELDRLSQAVIDATDKIENRAISTTEPNTDTATMTIPAAADRANKVLSFDSSGNAQTTTDAGGDVTLSGSQTLTNKTIDADNNTISNLEVDNIKAATLVTESEGISSNDNDTTLPTSAAVKDYVDTNAISASGSLTLTNKTIDADNNTISNLEVDNIKAATLVTESEGIGSNDNDTTLPTSAAVKDYVDTQITAEDLDITTDSGTIAIDLDSETLTVAGGTGLGSTATGNTVTLNIDSTVATLSGSQTLTNKTIDVDNNTVSNIEVDNLKSGVLDTDLSSVSGSDDTLASAKAIKAYVDTQDLATGIGDLTATGSTLISPSNADLTLDPSGSGNIVLNANTSVTGSVTATTSIENDAIRITDNTIIGLRSNEDLIIDPAGTGEVRPGSDVKLLSNSNHFVGNVKNEDGNALQLSSSAGIQLSGGTITAYNTIQTTGDDNHIQTDSIKIDAGSGVISTRRSNEDLSLQPTGTGNVILGAVKVNGTTISSDDSTKITLAENVDITGAVGITSGTITGITDLAVADGGTGASSLTDNAVLTGTGTSPITAESNLTFNGSTLGVTGNITASTTIGATTDITAGGSITAGTSIANDAVSIDDNVITASRSNDNLVITANGIGKVMLGNQDTDLTSVGSNKVGATMLYEDLTSSGGTRQYALNRIAQFKAVANTDSNSINDRFRIQDTVQFDLNGSTYSQTSNSRGPQIQHLVEIKNTGSSTSDTLGAANGQATGIYFPGSGGAGSTINLTNAYNIRAFSLFTPESGETVNVTNNYDFYSSGPTFAGSGTEAVTNHYGLFVSNNTNATNKYGVYVEGDSYINQLGGVTLQSGNITHTGNITTTGNISSTGSIGNDAVTITDNVIKTSRSNDTLFFQANGTGQIEFSPNGATVDGVFDTNTRYDFGANRIFSEQDADANSIFSDSGDRRYANGDFLSVSLASSSSNSHARWRSGTFSLMDMKGFSITSSANYFKGIVTRYAETMIKNTSTSTASTLNNITGVYSSLNTTGTDNGGGLTINSGYGFVTDIALGEGTSETVAMTNAYHYAVKGSSGGGAITNEYGVYVDGLAGTNKYGFFTADDSYINDIGGVVLQNGDITTPAISIEDNCIKTNRSNDSLYLKTNGTGQIQLTPNGGDFGSYSTNSRFANGNILFYQDQNDTVGDGNRAYKNIIMQDIKLGAGQSSSNSNDRWRNQAFINFDTNNSSITAASTQYRSRGPMGLEAFAKVTNSSSSNVTVGNASGGNYGVSIYPTGSGNTSVTYVTGMGTYFEVAQNTGDITVTDYVAYESIGIDRYDNSGGSPGDFTINDVYHFRAGASAVFGAGTTTFTDNFGFYFEGDSNATNNYAFYDASNGQSLLGDVLIKQNTISTNSSNANLELSASGTGSVVFNSPVSFDGITLNDNTISTNASNADLEINTSGTGQIKTSAPIIGIGSGTGGNIILTDQADGSFQTSSGASPGMLSPSGLQVDSAGSFKYSQLILNNFSTNAYNALWTTRSNSNTHGTNAYLDSGDVIFQFFGAGWNGDTDGTGYFSGNTIVDLYASEAHSASNRGGGFRIKTINKGAASGATEKLRVEDHVETHEKLEFKKNYQENIDALTSSSTITVDCSAASVFTVTLATNTQFVISNLPTGGSVTLIITQDGTGNRTATFGTDGSTAVKFAGGSKTLSTAANAIDVVTVFNDGTNFIGSLSLSYAA